MTMEHTSHPHVSNEDNKKVQDIVNKVVATEAVYLFKLYHRHFYVKGSHFFTLHEKFEELYTHATGVFDEIAERLLAINGQPYSSMTEFIEHSALEDYPQSKKTADMDMVRDTISDIHAIVKLLVDAIELTSEVGDSVTEDLLIGYKTEYDKQIWMLNAFLGRAAE